MQPVLIDEEGEPHPADCAKIADRVRLLSPECDVVAAAISRLGLIHIFPIGQSLIISLRPHLVAAKTMVGAFYQIYDFQPERILVDSSDCGTPELHYGCHGAFARIYRLVSSPESTGLYRGAERWPVV